MSRKVNFIVYNYVTYFLGGKIMDNNLFGNFIEKAFSGDKKIINAVFIKCDLYFRKYRNLIVGIYDYEDFRQIFILKVLKLIKCGKMGEIKNLNGYMYAILKNTLNELMKKNINCRKNISIDIYNDNVLFLYGERDFEEECIKNSDMLEMKKAVINAINKLNDNERDIVKACYFKEISIADYSRKNKLNYYTCAKRLGRTKNKILKSLKLYSACKG